MPETITLIESLQSSSVKHLIKELSDVGADNIIIDALSVRSLGSLSASVLLRFKVAVDAGGGKCEIKASTDFINDWNLIGFSKYLCLEGEGA